MTAMEAVVEDLQVKRYAVQVLIDGEWQDEDYFATKARAKRYVRNCRFWDALQRRAIEVG